MPETKGINRSILKLTLPAIAANITVPLLGLCDTALTGHLGSEKYLAAIAVGTTMLNVVFWLFGFLRMGTTGMAAQAFGSGDETAVRRVFTRSVSLGFSLGLSLALFAMPLCEALKWLVGADPSVSDLAERYFLICILEAPALLATMAVTGWFVGMQSTAWPMVISVTVNIINIITSFILVYPVGLGFIGTAWGTLSATWIGLLLALVAVKFFRRGKQTWENPIRSWRDGSSTKFFKVNTALFIRSLCITAVTLGVTATGARIGAATLAVNAVLIQFFIFFSFFMDGLAFSAEALVGKWYGASDIPMVRECKSKLLIWSLCVAAAFTLLYTTCLRPFSGLLTDVMTVREGVWEMRWYICALPAIAVWAFIYDGFFIGITATKYMMTATIIASSLFFLSTYPVSSPSNNMLWTAFLGYLFVRGISLAIIWKRKQYAK